MYYTSICNIRLENYYFGDIYFLIIRKSIFSKWHIFLDHIYDINFLTYMPYIRIVCIFLYYDVYFLIITIRKSIFSKWLRSRMTSRSMSADILPMNLRQIFHKSSSTENTNFSKTIFLLFILMRILRFGEGEYPVSFCWIEESFSRCHQAVCDFQQKVANVARIKSGKGVAPIKLPLLDKSNWNPTPTVLSFLSQLLSISNANIFHHQFFPPGNILKFWQHLQNFIGRTVHFFCSGSPSKNN